ncbi:predicted protein [Sclerotinia sclerotiorum 1980 UF-70]|uniref:Uncharacterized protein n=1 Tax=Sclerotinia sclerotiorum (strain ATCC 18683 / 1980 / Ss-1) TaxID=665079 RepID=A7ETP8_SCLS1|nr:predicted protein [Sclerotinia sclerotiorum 1980 UF-70]EDN92840.1 predicted protein [Sclerotinia sclerotiorum 1980 UF-70]
MSTEHYSSYISILCTPGTYSATIQFVFISAHSVDKTLLLVLICTGGVLITKSTGSVGHGDLRKVTLW